MLTNCNTHIVTFKLMIIHSPGSNLIHHVTDCGFLWPFCEQPPTTTSPHPLRNTLPKSPLVHLAWQQTEYKWRWVTRFTPALTFPPEERESLLDKDVFCPWLMETFLKQIYCPRKVEANILQMRKLDGVYPWRNAGCKNTLMHHHDIFLYVKILK